MFFFTQKSRPLASSVFLMVPLSAALRVTDTKSLDGFSGESILLTTEAESVQMALTTTLSEGLIVSPGCFSLPFINHALKCCMFVGATKEH